MKKLLNILHDIRPEFDFSKSQNFIDDGYLDSFDLVTLVAAIEKEYGIKVKGTEIIPENFCNLAAINTLVSKYGVQDAL